MKKIFSIFIILTSLIFSKTITTKTAVNLYFEPNGKSKVVGVIMEGKTIPVIDEVYSYYYVDIIKGETKKNTSDHAGKSGFMWSGRVGVISEMVIVEGCTLRSSPVYLNNETWKDSSDDPNFIAKVKKGAKIKIDKSKSKVSWYKVEGGYIYHSRVE